MVLGDTKFIIACITCIFLLTTIPCVAGFKPRRGAICILVSLPFRYGDRIFYGGFLCVVVESGIVGATVVCSVERRERPNGLISRLPICVEVSGYEITSFFSFPDPSSSYFARPSFAPPSSLLRRFDRVIVFFEG